MDNLDMRRLLVQAAENLQIMNERGKISKKLYAENDALVGRLLRAAIETLDDKVSVDVVGWPKIDTSQ